jgi:hypothetical protein
MSIAFDITETWFTSHNGEGSIVFDVASRPPAFRPRPDAARVETARTDIYRAGAERME